MKLQTSLCAKTHAACYFSKADTDFLDLIFAGTCLDLCSIIGHFTAALNFCPSSV